MSAAPLLQVKNLTVGIQRHGAVLKLIENINFDVYAGETLGIVGESGSGKSTTGLALMQLQARSSRAHTTGQVMLGEKDVLRMDDVQLRQMRGRDISMVLQDPMASLNPAFTVGQQIEEAFAVHKRCAPHERRERAVEALRRVRIINPEKRNQRHHWMSRYRLNISIF
jgi:peptide/nickel transport system ATP-binding protein